MTFQFLMVARISKILVSHRFLKKLLFQRVFSTFSPAEKSAKIGPHPGSELGADFAPSTSSARLEGFFTDAAGVWMQFPGG